MMERRGEIPVRGSGARPTDEWFLAKVTCGGPLGEELDPPIYEGPIYWFVSVYVDSSELTDFAVTAFTGPTKLDSDGERVPASPSETSAEGFEPADDGWIAGRFVNLSEVVDDTHNLKLGAVVMVRIWKAQDGSDLYIVEA